MSLLATAAPYAGPALADISDFGDWSVSFLDAAEALNVRAYYLDKDYEDPDLADYISPAKMHLITTHAEFAEPEVRPGISAAAYEEAVHRRQRHVSDHITLAVMNECAAIKARAARFATQYLRSALHPQLRDSLGASNNPFDLWEALRSRSRAAPSGSAWTRLPQALAVTLGAHDDCAEFFDRFEAAMEAYANVLLPPCAVAPESLEAVVDRLKVTFLALACGPRSTTSFDRWRLADPHCTFKQLKACVEKAHVSGANSHNLPQTHREAACSQVCIRGGATGSGVDVSRGEALPATAEPPTGSSRTFCSHCRCTDHRGADCTRRFDDGRTAGESDTADADGRKDSSKRLRVDSTTDDDELPLIQMARRRSNDDLETASESDDEDGTGPMTPRVFTSTPWTDDECKHLINLVGRYGNRWQLVLDKALAKGLLLPIRTAQAIKAKYYHLRSQMDATLPSRKPAYSTAEIDYMVRGVAKYGVDEAATIFERGQRRGLFFGRNLRDFQVH
ncbi:hypothetical protein ACHHYP_08939 [Achlya hypogyna]|uniref:Myb-like domain-containing protein n=1 Tax=Achlya hypogyna TaxID=1202772 RepID=A0A1V9ZJU0_ACHHY|nr:hypothetical protein ACHHYP_08939 [Achlya hypogyna]